MKPNEFQMWIKGYVALSDELYLTPQQLRIICNHANLVKVINKSIDFRIEKFISEIKKLTALNENIPLHILRHLYEKSFPAE